MSFNSYDAGIFDAIGHVGIIGETEWPRPDLTWRAHYKGILDYVCKSVGSPNCPFGYPQGSKYIFELSYKIAEPYIRELATICVVKRNQLEAAIMILDQVPKYPTDPKSVLLARAIARKIKEVTRAEYDF